MIRLATVLFLCLATAATARAQADLVVHGALVHTVDASYPEAEAFAVKAGRVVMVGTDAQILSAYPSAPRMNARGKTIIPGLIDAHAHLVGLAQSLLAADLMGTSSRADVIARLKAFERDLPEGAWLIGRGWDQNDWRDADGTTDFPTRQDLDDAFPARPVWLERIDGHASWGNTAAIRAAGGVAAVQAMRDPEGGKILRDASGVPTGVFVDAASGIVGRNVPGATAEQMRVALEEAVALANSHGLTGVHDAGLSLEAIVAIRQAIDAGEFDLRLYAMIGGAGETLDYFCDNGPIMSHGGKLTVRSVKFYMDGALGSRGAALLEDYHDDAGNRGLLMVQPEAFEPAVRKAMTCGLQVNTHAIGDAGNRAVLDAYESALASVGHTAGRHRVEHAQVVALEDIARFRELGLIASVQPTHATSDMYWAADRVGPDRVMGAYAWRRFADQGTPLALGSDFPVERVAPLLGFYAAVTRQDADGWPEGGWMAHERLTRLEALRGFTLGAAYAAFQETDLGSITPGKRADFVVLDRDIMTVPADEILGTQIVATYLGGEAVYEAGVR